MDKPIDTLIVGGPSVTCTMSCATIRQLPFTLEGLAAAYRLLPQCKVVVIVPDLVILSTMPSCEMIEGFDEDGRLNPIVTTLGLLDLPTNIEPVPVSLSAEVPIADTVPVQVARNLARVPEGARAVFARRAASAFIGRVLDRTFNIVNGGGTVYLLFPEEYPSWPDTDKAVIGDQVPGLIIDGDETWAARVGGDQQWLIEGVRSGLRFGWANAYSELLEEEGYVGVSDPLPHPDRVLKLLPAEISVSVSQGAVDRAGQQRVLALHWGRGSFVVAPALCWSPLLARLGVGACVDGDLSSAQGQADTPEALQGQNPSIPVDALASMLPDMPDGIRAWDSALVWRAGSVRSVAEIACSLDALPAGPRRKPTDTVRVFTLEGKDPDRKITAATLRKLIERKLHITDLPDGLRKMLECALAAWNQHFLNT